MWLPRIGLFFSSVFLALTAWSQQAQLPANPPPAPKDPQALGVVNQALAVAGGAPAIMAILDYTATGNLTYRLAQDVQGTVTARCLGLGQFRLDASLPTGVRTELINGDGVLKTEDGTTKHYQHQ